ncbi:MAG: hypothetical protein WBQ86_17885 [Candidatus Binatus sp.]
MARKHKTAIRSIFLGAAAILAFSIQISMAKPAEKEKPQGLWVGGSQYISEFQGKALSSSGDPGANLTFGNSTYTGPVSIAFDTHNNLWAIYYTSDPLPITVIELSRADLASFKSGNRVKPKVIALSFIFPVQLAFDASGDLWITAPESPVSKIIELLPGQIKKKGAPSPTISITSSDFVPEAIRFDASDNLWVAQLQEPYEPSHSIQMGRYAPADRAVSGPATPGLIVNLPDYVVLADFAFDKSGNLWLAGSNSLNDRLEMISAADLNGSGEVSPTAAMTITSSAFGVLNGGGGGSCLGGIDFDRSGDLWASVAADSAICQGGAQLVEFTPGQLSTGGSLTPSVTISQNAKETNLLVPGPLRFGPTVP